MSNLQQLARFQADVGSLVHRYRLMNGRNSQMPFGQIRTTFNIRFGYQFLLSDDDIIETLLQYGLLQFVDLGFQRVNIRENEENVNPNAGHYRDPNNRGPGNEPFGNRNMNNRN